ncbi:MotE family protein [Rhizobiales bacterium Sp-1]|uniref:MotE family protein n=2 Tax=Segnochrobactrum spirostomi TaxID=2608987 RepID=A0A6A7Y3T8_9HYPH|nr:MotE family protein [Segnochrobactrum spirostomi]
MQRGLLGPAFAVLVMMTAAANAETAAPAADAQGAAPAAADAAPAQPQVPVDAASENAIEYCKNITNAAADARFARQAATLKELEAEVDKRIAALEAKRAEYQSWLQRREDFLRKADESVIAIYTQMKPEATATQLSIMPDEAAAAILAKLQPRIASAVLNEMDPAKAAQLAAYMTGLAARDIPKGTGG